MASELLFACENRGKTYISVEGFSGNKSPGGVFEEKSTTPFFNLI